MWDKRPLPWQRSLAILLVAGTAIVALGSSGVLGTGEPPLTVESPDGAYVAIVSRMSMPLGAEGVRVRLVDRRSGTSEVVFETPIGARSEWGVYWTKDSSMLAVFERGADDTKPRPVFAYDTLLAAPQPVYAVGGDRSSAVSAS